MLRNSALTTDVDSLTTPGTYQWTVAVPAGTAEGRYQLGLIQSGNTVFSPVFDLSIPPEESSATTSAETATVTFPGDSDAASTTSSGAAATTTTTVTAIYLPYSAGPTGAMPAVTYIYWEDECGCHKTSSCMSSEMPTSMSSTTVTYYEDNCGCSKTVEASCAPTVIAPTPAPASNWTAPAANTPPAPVASPAVTVGNTPVAPASTASTAVAPAYTGAADKVAGSVLGVAAVVMAAVLAA